MKQRTVIRRRRCQVRSSDIYRAIVTGNWPCIKNIEQFLLTSDKKSFYIYYTDGVIDQYFFLNEEALMVAIKNINRYLKKLTDSNGKI